MSKSRSLEVTKGQQRPEAVTIAIDSDLTSMSNVHTVITFELSIVKINYLDLCPKVNHLSHQISPTNDISRSTVHIPIET
jgi:thiosulfate reductase cytochrome b subunit